MRYSIDPNSKCAVIGHGSWATALVKILLENEKEIIWYVRNPDVASYLKSSGSNPKYLRDVHFDSGRIDITDDIDYAVNSAEIIILAVPSAFIKDVLADLTASLKGKFVVSAIKGIIPGNYITVAEYLNYKYELPYDGIGIITGPCHSEEVALERLSYLTIVSKSTENARALCRKFRTGYIEANPSTDIYGAEYASVLKNIYAICAGMAVGLGYGDNFLSVLVSNSALEMEKFLKNRYQWSRDICASAYLGDLLVTCYSQFSRNRTFGAMIGKGYSIKSAQAEMNMIAEGYYASKCIRQMTSGKGIEMPIADCVYNVLYEGRTAKRELKIMTTKLI